VSEVDDILLGNGVFDNVEILSAKAVGGSVGAYAEDALLLLGETSKKASKGDVKLLV
jgi:hypothetical protein